MQMTTGAVNGEPALIDFDRNEFAPFPFGHELVFNDGRPTGFQTTSERHAQPLATLPWQGIPFNANVRGHRPRRAQRARN